jgi:hypothetical protein
MAPAKIAIFVWCLTVMLFSRAGDRKAPISSFAEALSAPASLTLPDNNTAVVP